MAGAPAVAARGLTKLKQLDLRYTQIADAGCATLAAALDSGALPALQGRAGWLHLQGTPASDTAKDAVHEVIEARDWERPRLTSRLSVMVDAIRCVLN